MLHTTDRGLNGARAGWLAAGMAVILGLLMLATPAKAADQPFEIQFDKSDVKIGVLGDLLGSGGLPLGDLASGGSLKGTISDDGKVTIPKGSFTMPQIGIDDPVKIRVFLGIEGPATGTFDRTTGQLELDSEAGLWLRLDAGALLDLLGLDIGDLLGASGSTGGINIGSMIKPLLSNLTCGFSPMNVHFTTGSNSLASGSPFTAGPTGQGAITTEWSQLGPFKGQTKILGLIDPCQMLLDYLPGLIEGGVGGALPGGVDLGGLDLAGLLSNLNNLNLGPSSITLTRSVSESLPPDSPAGTSKAARLQIKVAALERRIKRPWKARYRVKVKNVGTAAAKKSQVCIAGFAVKRACFKLGQINVGQTKTKVFTAKVSGKRLKLRRQRVLRPLFTAKAQGTATAKHRHSTTRLLGS